MSESQPIPIQMAAKLRKRVREAGSNQGNSQISCLGNCLSGIPESLALELLDKDSPRENGWCIIAQPGRKIVKNQSVRFVICFINYFA
jgi:hypothetical protein